MVFGQGFISQSYQHNPETPIKLQSASNESSTFSLSELISASAPEFTSGSTTVLNPMYFNGHLQTLYAAVGDFSKVDRVHYGRTVLNFPDGATGTADYAISKDLYEKEAQQEKWLPPRTRFFTDDEYETYVADQSRQSKPIVLILHGLSGGSYKSYVRCMIHKLDLDEFDAVVLNSRGCARHKITTPQLFCGLWTDDVRYLVQDLKEKYPARAIYGVGFSLGASILANYIGQEGDDCPLTAACIVGNPWDLCESSYALHRSFIGRNLYSPVMCKNLKRLLLRNLEELKTNENFKQSFESKFDQVQSISDFDNEFTCKMFGFNTAYEYYRHGSSVNRLLNFRVPTLILNSLDDPVVGAEAIPYAECAKNPYVTLVTTDYGGHLGWFKYNNERWYSQPLCDFFKNFQHTVKLDAKTAKAVIADEGIVPKQNSFNHDRISMVANPYYIS